MLGTIGLILFFAFSKDRQFVVFWWSREKNLKET